MNNFRRLLTFNRILGLVIVVISTASLFVTAYALYISGPVADDFTASLTSAADSAAGLLDTSLLALQTTADGLADSRETLQAIDQAFLTFDQAVVNSFDLLITTGDLTGENLPQMLDATQRSIATAQQTAGSIEAVLGFVSQIPFFPGGPYKPEVPLDKALGSVSADLEALAPALETMTKSLDDTYANMRQVQADILDIIIQLRKTGETLGQAQAVVSQYQAQAQDIEADLAAFSAGLPARINLALWFARFILLWLGIGQGALLLYGVRTGLVESNR